MLLFSLPLAAGRTESNAAQKLHTGQNAAFLILSGSRHIRNIITWKKGEGKTNIQQEREGALWYAFSVSDMGGKIKKRRDT